MRHFEIASCDPTSQTAQLPSDNPLSLIVARVLACGMLWETVNLQYDNRRIFQTVVFEHHHKMVLTPWTTTAQSRAPSIFQSRPSKTSGRSVFSVDVVTNRCAVDSIIHLTAVVDTFEKSLKVEHRVHQATKVDLWATHNSSNHHDADQLGQWQLEHARYQLLLSKQKVLQLHDPPSQGSQWSDPCHG